MREFWQIASANFPDHQGWATRKWFACLKGDEALLHGSVNLPSPDVVVPQQETDRHASPAPLDGSVNGAETFAC